MSALEDVEDVEDVEGVKDVEDLEDLEVKSPDEKTARLEREAVEIREKLASLVTELDHRTYGLGPRLVKPLVIAAALAGAIVVGLWVRRRLRALLRPLD